MNVPETRYAVTPDGVHLAYHVIGDGPIDVLWIHTMQGGLELLWEDPRIRSLSEKVATFGRLTRHDMRATGLSDRNTPLPDLETQARDMLTVLDAVGSHSVVVFSAGNPAGPFFAATYPRRTRALFFFEPSAREVSTDGYPWGYTQEEADRELVNVERSWGRDAYAGGGFKRGGVVFEVDIGGVETAGRRDHRDVRRAQLVDAHHQCQLVRFQHPLDAVLADLRGHSGSPPIRVRDTILRFAGPRNAPIFR